MEEHKGPRHWVKINAYTCSRLGEFFKNIWIETFNHEWDVSQLPIILDHDNLKSITKSQQEMIEEGNVDQWDITLLKTLLVTPGLFNLTSDLSANIIKISNICNELSLHQTKFVTEHEFDVWWQEVQQILVDFGAPDAELKQLKQDCGKSGAELLPAEKEINEQNEAEALKLKEKGNVSFKNGEFVKAIQLYTEAVGLPSLPSGQRAILSTNRCITYLKRHEKKFGKNHLIDANLLLAEIDAKKAIELAPNWYKGYFRLGQVHLAAGKHKIAEEYLNEALSKEPKNKDILQALSNARMLRDQQEQVDYLDSLNASNSKSVYIQEGTQERCLNFNMSVCKDFLAAEVDNLELKNCQKCLKGHCYKTGTYGYPRDDGLAAQYYREAAEHGSAEAMLNLGWMMVRGYGVEQDYQAGIELLKEAASQSSTNLDDAVNFGVAESEHAIALCYAEGIGITKDLAEAVIWYQRACKHGCTTASNYLGSMYEWGIISGKPDLVNAEKYYHMAAKAKSNTLSVAMFNLARICALKGDFERALKWCRRSKENGCMKPFVDEVIEKLVKETNSSGGAGLLECATNAADEGLTTQECRNHSYSGETLKLATSGTGHKILDRTLKTFSLPIIHNGNDRFTAEKLIKCSETSDYARYLWIAKQHCIAALDALLKLIERDNILPIEDCEKFIVQFATGAKLEFMVFELLPQLRHLALSIVNKLLTQKTHFDEDVNVCYISLQDASSAESTISFLNSCIQKYPQNIFFHKMRAKLNAFLKRYEDSVADANAVLQLCPSDWDSLFVRAQMMHVASPTFPPQVSIDAYTQFLEHAPKDHWKVPEAFYGIAQLLILKTQMCNMQVLNAGDRLGAIAIFTKVLKYYDQGKSAEKQQLIFFLPYASDVEAQLENYFSKNTGMLASSIGLTTGVAQKNPESYNLHNKLSDPYRIAKITQHRRFINASHKAGVWTRNNFVTVDKMVTTPAPKQPSSKSLTNLKVITLQDMDPTKDFVYQRCMLGVTVIDEVAFTGSSISLVVEDIKGHVERCFIYNSPVMGDQYKSTKKFGPGCRMIIIGPYMRMAQDKKPAIRVDDPASIIPKDFVTQMCRYCCKPNATVLCAKCKIALYCNDVCKKLDWEKMQHKLICR